jgi:hypothetical protein
VKAPLVVWLRIYVDLWSSKRPAGKKQAAEGEYNMFSKILSFGRYPSAGNENGTGARAGQSGMVSAENVRALATGAALAVALDTSPAVLVSMYDYAHRVGDHQRRRIAC